MHHAHAHDRCSSKHLLEPPPFGQRLFTNMHVFESRNFVIAAQVTDMEVTLARLRTNRGELDRIIQEIKRMSAYRSVRNF